MSYTNKGITLILLDKVCKLGTDKEIRSQCYNHFEKALLENISIKEYINKIKPLLSTNSNESKDLLTIFNNKL